MSETTVQLPTRTHPGTEPALRGDPPRQILVGPEPAPGASALLPAVGATVVLLARRAHPPVVGAPTSGVRS